MRTVAEVMTQDVRTATVDDVVGSIRDLMLDGELHGVPVLDHDGELVGIVTSSDLVEEWAPEQGIVTVMTDGVRTVQPDTPICAAARAMIDQRVHHLAVVDASGVVGLISSFDMLRELAARVEVAGSRATAGRWRASPGDHVVIRGKGIDRRERRGVIVEIRGDGGGPPYVVNWLDDPHMEPHDVIFYPSTDADLVRSVEQQSASTAIAAGS